MDLKVVALRPRKNEAVVSTLRDALALAEAGELVSVVIVGAELSGGVVRMHAVTEQRLAILAGLHLAATRVAERCLSDAKSLEPPDAG